MKLMGLVFAAMLLVSDASGWAPSAALSNPYYISDPSGTIDGTAPFTDTAGHIPTPCKPVTGRTAVIVSVGQSLRVNSIPGVYTQTQTAGDELNIFDGGCYKLKTPLLGTNGGGSNEAQWLADKLLADGYYDRVIIVPMAIGNTTVDEWATDGAPLYFRDHIRVAGRRVADAGLTCTAIIWGQGESDVWHQTTQAAYAASFSIIISAFNTALPGCPFFVNLESYYPINTSWGSNIRAAQIGVINGTTVFQGADIDTIPTSERYDGLHLAPTGATHAAALEEAALVAALHL